jgi:hypothetical protein
MLRKSTNFASLVNLWYNVYEVLMVLIITCIEGTLI